jgi:hypothetical protein
MPNLVNFRPHRIFHVDSDRAQTLAVAVGQN